MELKRIMRMDMRDTALRLYKRKYRLRKDQLSDVLESVYRGNKTFWRPMYGDYDAFFYHVFRKEIIKVRFHVSENIAVTRIGDRFLHFKKRPKYVTVYGKRKRTGKKEWKLLSDIEAAEEMGKITTKTSDILGRDILKKRKRSR